MKLLIILILLVLLIAGCTQAKDVKQQAIDLCIQICRVNPVNAPLERVYANGPCLSDKNSDWNITDWVCDVAHNPRQPVDDEPENQCQDFRNGKAHHFVEVDTSCSFIRAV